MAAASLANVANAKESLDSCLLAALKAAETTTTVGELRTQCAESTAAVTSTEPDRTGALAHRLDVESSVAGRPFAITAHQPSYFLVTSSSSPNQAPFTDLAGADNPVEDTEVEFQVSIKVPVWQDMFDTGVDTYVAYTAKSWWQMFTGDFSAPFRETNYQPEIFLRNTTPKNLLGMTLAGWDLGLNHESNGRADQLSRSWNRVMARAAVSLTDDINLFARAWYRLPEDDEDDDNPDTYKYYGYGDVRVVWTPNDNTITALLRPGTEKLSYELTWSRPIGRNFRLYAQYYHGYGESLLDYDYKNRRFGIGISLNDFLERH